MNHFDGGNILLRIFRIAIPLLAILITFLVSKEWVSSKRLWKDNKITLPEEVIYYGSVVIITSLITWFFVAYDVMEKSADINTNSLIAYIIILGVTGCIGVYKAIKEDSKLSKADKVQKRTLKKWHQIKDENKFSNGLD